MDVNEIRRKQRHPGRFIDGKNAVIVHDPREVSDLAEKLRRALLDPEWTSAVGRAGHELFEPVDPDLLVESYEAAFERAGRWQTPVRGHGSVPSAEASREKDVLLRDEYPASHAVLTAATSDIKFTDCVSACGATRVDLALLRAADGLGQGVPAWWADILRYDAGRAWLRKEPYWPVPRHWPERSYPGGLRNRDWLDLYPMLQAPVKTMEFGTPVHDAEGALRGGVHPRALKPVARATTLMFVKSGDLLGRTYEVPGAVATLIPLLDGSRPIREICDLAAVDPDDLAKLLAALKAENVLRLHLSAQSRPMFPDDP